MPAFFRMNLDRTSDFTNPLGLLLGGLLFLPKTKALFMKHATRLLDATRPASFQNWIQIYNTLTCVSSSGRELMSAWLKQANLF